jgi:hypothetical protein
MLNIESDCRPEAGHCWPHSKKKALAWNNQLTQVSACSASYLRPVSLLKKRARIMDQNSDPALKKN